MRNYRVISDIIIDEKELIRFTFSSNYTVENYIKARKEHIELCSKIFGKKLLYNVILETYENVGVKNE